MKTMYRQIALFSLLIAAIIVTGCPQQKPSAPTPAAGPEQQAADAVKPVMAAFVADKVITAEDLAALPSKIELTSVKITNVRDFDDEMVATYIKPLKNLKTLTLTNCQISNTAIDTIVESCPALEEVDLSMNPLLNDLTLAKLAKLPKLKRLVILQCQLTDIGMMHVQKMPNLEVLDVRGAVIADMGLRNIVKAPKLRALKIRSSAVMDSSIEVLAESPTLEILAIEDAPLTSNAGQYFRKIPQLKQLDIFRCGEFGTEGLAAMEGLPLTRLLLRGLPVDDRGMELIGKMTTLRTLALLELPSITPEGIMRLAGLKGLKSLDLWRLTNDALVFNEEVMKPIVELPNLESLRIRENRATEEIVPMILAMPKLRELSFYGNLGIPNELLEKFKAKQYKKLEIVAPSSSVE